MIDNSRRAAISELALRALDQIEEDYGDDATLGEAVLIFEVEVPAPDEADTALTHVNYLSTMQRTVVSVGLLTLALEAMTQSR